jgi:2-methylcitrate dehydratase PrpD
MSPDILTDADILRVSSAVELNDDEELTRKSVNQRWAAVTLITNDGQRFAASPKTPRGDIDQPLSDQEMLEKYRMFAVPILGAERAEHMRVLCASFDTLNAMEFSALLDLLLRKA